MQAKSIVVLIILAVVFPTATSYARQSPDKQAQSGQQQDSRYRVYVKGIT